MPTVGQITDKLAELKSKIAVYEGLVLHLKANYLPSDSGEAEMHFTRSDYATVPPTHVEAAVADIVDQIDGLRAELRQWEGLSVAEPKKPEEKAEEKAEDKAEEPEKAEDKPAEAKPEAPNTNGSKPAAKKPAKEKPASGATQTGSEHRDQPPPGEAGQPKAG